MDVRSGRNNDSYVHFFRHRLLEGSYNSCRWRKIRAGNPDSMIGLSYEILKRKILPVSCPASEITENRSVMPSRDREFLAIPDRIKLASRYHRSRALNLDAEIAPATAT